STLRLPPRPPLFPYTTLFRSHDRRAPAPRAHAAGRDHAVAEWARHLARGLGPARLARLGRPRGQPPALAARLHARPRYQASAARSEEHTSELQSRRDLVCRLL